MPHIKLVEGKGDYVKRVHKDGTIEDVCECIWNADCNEISAGGIMTGKVRCPSFEGRVCNCSPENPIALLEAAKVRCYPENEGGKRERIRSTGR